MAREMTFGPVTKIRNFIDAGAKLDHRDDTL